MKTNKITTIVFVGLISLVSQKLKAQCFSKVFAGENHVIAQKSNGSIWSWGWAEWGPLGTGSSFNAETPQQIGAATDWTFINAGHRNSIAIKSNGTLWASGDNYYGQLGINSNVLTNNLLTQIGTDTNWKQVASTNFTLGVRTDGTLWAWGENHKNQMGDGSCCANRLAPGQIGTATDWKKVGMSQVHNGFALKNNGTIWGWGSNGGYLLGGSEVTSRQFPTQLNAANDWADFSIGAAHILALKTNGTLWAWGGGDSGETADGLPLIFVRDVPMPVLGGGTWKAIAAGFKTSFGIKSNGTLWAWGLNDEGQLGLGNTTNQNLPVQIGTATNWASVSVRGQFVVALKTDGSLWAWGFNFFGNLGNGTTQDEPLPVQIPVAGCALGNEIFSVEKAITIAPNPVQNDLQININGNVQLTEVIVFDMVGKQVYQTEVVAGSNIMMLNVASLSKGMYMVVFKNGNETVSSKKVLKE